MVNLTGYGVTVARIVWDDLVSVRIRVPRQKRISIYGGYGVAATQRSVAALSRVQIPLVAQLNKILI